MIRIDNAKQLYKLLSFLRGGGKAEFEFPTELAQQVIDTIKGYAKEQGVSFHYVSPSGEKIAACTAIGAAGGIAMAAFFTNPVAALLLGGLAGGALGYGAAHIDVEFSKAQADGNSRMVLK